MTSKALRGPRAPKRSFRISGGTYMAPGCTNFDHLGAKGTKNLGKIGPIALIEILIPQTPQNPPLTPKHPIVPLPMFYSGTMSATMEMWRVLSDQKDAIADLLEKNSSLEKEKVCITQGSYERHYTLFYINFFIDN